MSGWSGLGRERPPEAGVPAAAEKELLPGSLRVAGLGQGRPQRARRPGPTFAVGFASVEGLEGGVPGQAAGRRGVSLGCSRGLAVVGRPPGRGVLRGGSRPLGPLGAPDKALQAPFS